MKLRYLFRSFLCTSDNLNWAKHANEMKQEFGSRLDLKSLSIELKLSVTNWPKLLLQYTLYLSEV